MSHAGEAREIGLRFVDGFAPPDLTASVVDDAVRDGYNRVVMSKVRGRLASFCVLHRVAHPMPNT